MKSQLFIPIKCKVGFNLRKDTYTGKLGYVIYHDGKKWRKEDSWNGWREKFIEGEEYEATRRKQYDDRFTYNNKHYTGDDLKRQMDWLGTYEAFKPSIGKLVNDKTIEPIEFDNVPTEGFVLNKKAGGYSTGWNHRSTYCRVYDPRGFEFEISIPNLLFILQECNAMRGKGLEGTFVYAWEGKDIVLLPTSSEDYQQSANFTKMQSGKVGVKDLIVGCVYRDKKLVDYIYLGKFNWLYGSYNKAYFNKSYIFRKAKIEEGPRLKHYLHPLESLTSLSMKVTDIPVDNYSELMDEFTNSGHAGSINDMVVTDYEFPIKISSYNRRAYGLPQAMKLVGDNKYELYALEANAGESISSRYYSSEYSIKSYNLKTNKLLTLTGDGDFSIKTIPTKNFDNVNISDVAKMELKTLKTKINNEDLKIEF